MWNALIRKSLAATLLSLSLIHPAFAQMPGMPPGAGMGGGMYGGQQQEQKEAPKKKEYMSILKEVETGEYKKAKSVAEKKTLVEYALAGDDSGVNRAIAEGQDINMQDEFGNTAMHHAAANGNMALLNLLGVFGAKPDVQNKAGITPLYAALKAEKFKAAEALHKQGARINIDNSEGSPVIFALVAAGDPLEAVKWLGERRINLFKKNAAGETLVQVLRKNKDAKTTLNHVENEYKKSIRAYYEKRGQEVPKGALDF